MAKIGIDFGTTNSLIVAYDRKDNEFRYYNYLGGTPVPTPSTVWYHDDSEPEVGTKARKNISTFCDIEGHHFEKSIKLKLGSNNPIPILGKMIEPYKVAGRILSYLKRQAIDEWHAEEDGVDLNYAVFTIPISFSGEARRDLRKAANEAGIEITTFIHEPFAAIVGYYFATENTGFRSVIDQLESMEGQYLLTFDWGGGTLDITVVQIHDGKMIELGTAELTNEAGDKFDEYIASCMWNRFLDKYGDKYKQGYLDELKKAKWGRMLNVAEACKIALSSKERAEFVIEKITSTEGIDEVVTRSDLNTLLADTISKASVCIDNALSQAGVHTQNISHVLLTGGSCYIPTVQEHMKKKFGHRVDNVTNADLLIAQGAAVIAEMGWLPFLTKDIQIQMCDDSYWPIFEKGMPIVANGEELAHRAETFTCVDQRNNKAKVIVCEGFEQTSDKVLAVLNVDVLGDNRFGDDVVVDASIDRDIVLIIKAHSKMVHGYGKQDAYSIRVSKQIYKLCFGLDFGGDDYGRQ